jgi:formate hydrogenlyase subunit 3/multisubunit Na+/H+ antiporter MnhD subunit
MIIKDLILKNKIALVILFVLFLTIILYGLTKAVLKMSYSISQDENEKQLPVKKEINWTMYLPQIVLLIIAFALGLYMPNYLINIIKLTVLGF